MSREWGESSLVDPACFRPHAGFLLNAAIPGLAPPSSTSQYKPIIAIIWGLAPLAYVLSLSVPELSTSPSPATSSTQEFTASQIKIKAVEILNDWGNPGHPGLVPEDVDDPEEWGVTGNPGPSFPLNVTAATVKTGETTGITAFSPEGLDNQFPGLFNGSVEFAVCFLGFVFAHEIFHLPAWPHDPDPDDDPNTPPPPAPPPGPNVSGAPYESPDCDHALLQVWWLQQMCGEIDAKYDLCVQTYPSVACVELDFLCALYKATGGGFNGPAYKEALKACSGQAPPIPGFPTPNADGEYPGIDCPFCP